MTVHGIGVDLVRIPRMRDVIARWDERFLRRVFTEGEIAYCRARRDPVPHFAARFAAKEAATKALGGRHMLLALTHDGDYALAQAMLVDDDPQRAPATR